MVRSRLDTAISFLQEAVAGVRENGSGLTAVDVRDILSATREVAQLNEQIRVGVVAAGQRDGVFAAAGHKKPDSPVANVLGVDRGVAREIVRGTEYTSPQIDAHGDVTPAVLPAMAAAFHAGRASLRHVDAIGRLLDSLVARQLPAEVRAGIEAQLAAVADENTPTRLARYGRELIADHHQHAPASEDDERPPVQVNELQMTTTPDGGLNIVGRFDDPVRAETIRAVIEAKSAPASATDVRTTAERQADALADALNFVLVHGDKVLPEAGGHRPQVNVHIQLSDLEHRARAATLDTGAVLHPTALRQLCCDSGVIPIVLDGVGQPLDIGRSGRTIPDAIRRAVTARDRGCAHPGCDRPPTWSEIHHIHEWTRGGHTRIDNLVMLCKIHHREIHSTEWRVRVARDGIPEFIPPSWLDPDRTPRRQLRVPPRANSNTVLPAWKYPPRASSKRNRKRANHATR